MSIDPSRGTWILAAGLGAAAALSADAEEVARNGALLTGPLFTRPWLAGTAVTALALLAAAALGVRLRPRRVRAEIAAAGVPYADTLRRVVGTLSDRDSASGTGEVVEAMFSAATVRDHETLAHSCRVARFAVALAERIGIRGETLTAIELGALLHDVGKADLPDELLRKAGPLSDDEMAVVREHPRRGYQLLKHLLFLGPALDVVLSHHERWDGGGYPNHLADEQIPLPARIFAVVDTYDAITSNRPYRPARDHADAVAELRRVAGTQLDPRVVERFLEIPESELERLRDLSRPIERPAEPSPPAAQAAGG